MRNLAWGKNVFEFERKISRKKQVYFVYWRTIGREMVCLRSTIRSVCGVKARKAFRRKVDRRVAKEGPSKRVKRLIAGGDQAVFAFARRL